MPGDLNILVVLADRFGVAPRPLPSLPPPPRASRPARSGVAPPCCASAVTIEPMFSARPAARNSLRFMLMASPLKGVETPRERCAGARGGPYTTQLGAKMFDVPHGIRTRVLALKGRTSLMSQGEVAQ